MPGAHDQHLSYVGVHGFGGVAHVESSVQNFGILKAEQTGSDDFGSGGKGRIMTLFCCDRKP